MKSGHKQTARGLTREYVDSRIEQVFTSLDAVLKAEKKHTVQCNSCGNHIDVLYPDVRAITDLLRLLFDQGYGKPAVDTQEHESDLQVLANVPADVRAAAMERLRAELAL